MKLDTTYMNLDVTWTKTKNSSNKNNNTNNQNHKNNNKTAFFGCDSIKINLVKVYIHWADSNWHLFNCSDCYNDVNVLHFILISRYYVGWIWIFLNPSYFLGLVLRFFLLPDLTGWSAGTDNDIKKGGTRSLPATPHRLQDPKWLPGGPKIADGVWKGVYP